MDPSVNKRSTDPYVNKRSTDPYILMYLQQQRAACFLVHPTEDADVVITGGDVEEWVRLRRSELVGYRGAFVCHADVGLAARCALRHVADALHLGARAHAHEQRAQRLRRTMTQRG